MRLPSLNALRAFDAAGRHLSFRAAADELHVTQGAVAQQVRGLEADLGRRLFHRLPRGLALTDDGAAYHREIARAYAIIARATATLVAQSAVVALSVPPSFASKWLVPRLAGFNKAHPGIEVRLDASAALSDLGPGGMDMAIRQGEGPFGAELRSEALAPLRLCAVAAPVLAAGRARTTDPCTLTDLPLIEDCHGHWRRLCGVRAHGSRARVLAVNQTALAIDAAAAGQGVTLAPMLLLADAVDAGQLTVLWQDLESHAAYHMIRPASVPPGPAAETMAGWLKAMLAG